MSNQGMNSFRVIRKELAYWVQKYNELRKEDRDMPRLRDELRKYGVVFNRQGEVVHF